MSNKDQPEPPNEPVLPIEATPRPALASGGVNNDTIVEPDAPPPGRASIVLLPDGVSEDEWADEKVRFQNPRIRAFMACNQRLEKARDSNYAILHCSPVRAGEIISILREVSDLIRLAIEPLVRVPSKLPAIENARVSIEAYLDSIEQEILQEIDKLPTHIREASLKEIRKQLCVWVGKLHAFLVDCQSELLAADPRNSREDDYFSSRRFPKDVEEAEWLHASVVRLCNVVETIERERDAALAQQASKIAKAGRVLDSEQSAATTGYLKALREVLVPKLRELISLKGIRVSEIELLDSHAMTLLQQTAVASELQALGESLVSPADANVVSARLVEILQSLNRRVRDIGAFVVVWEKMIAQRRALLLKNQPAPTK